MSCTVLLSVDAFKPELVASIRETTKGWAQLETVGQTAPAEEFEAFLQRAEVVIGWPKPGQLAGTPVRLLQTGSVGFDAYVGHGLEQRQPFTFCSARGCHSMGVAEHVLGLIFAFARLLPRHLADQRDHRFFNPIWNNLAENPYGEVNGSTACVVGLGQIGQQVAASCAGAGMRVIAVDPSPAAQSPVVEQVFPSERMHEALGHADHVILSVVGGPTTQGLVDRAFLQAMKPTANLYNVSRGSVIVEQELIEALRHGRLAGAGLDVFQNEPLPADSPLWSLNNVILTPHVAGFAAGYERRFCDLIVQNLRRYRNGEPLLNVVASLSSTDCYPPKT